jgi:hypothetical protein
MKKLSLNKKALTLVVAVIAILLAMTAPAALAYKEGPGTNWWYVDASYGGYHNSVPLVIEINGDSSAGQTFSVGDTVDITVELHAVAQSCGGDGNGAYTEWLLKVNGPSGLGSTGDWNYDYSSDCAVADEDTTLTITYDLTATGTHTVYMSSYAAVAQYWTDVAEESVDASLTFEVVPAVIPVDIDIKPGSDPNCFNSDGHGVIPVAILGSADFDASTVDPSTVSLDGAEVRVKGKSGNAGSLEDVNGDGFQDLVVQILDDETYSGDGTANLSGNLYADFGGTPIQGSDSICIRPPE